MSLSGRYFVREAWSKTPPLDVGDLYVRWGTTADGMANRDGKHTNFGYERRLYVEAVVAMEEIPGKRRKRAKAHLRDVTAAALPEGSIVPYYYMTHDLLTWCRHCLDASGFQEVKPRERN